MNRYRTLPGLGPQKATASTVCQKCLKKGHYSYECKSSVQERPYTSRPSRTQQLLNPKLTPKLASDTPNNLLNSKGVADQQLAEAQARRDELVVEPEDRGRSPTPGSSDSVSTISTNKSRSRSRSRSRERGENYFTSSRARRNGSGTPTTDISRKRKHRSISSSNSRSPRSPRREPGSHRKSRRHRTISPVDRGRPSSMRRGSHRSRTGSPSMDKSQITKQRRSLEEEAHAGATSRGHRRNYDDNDRHELPQRDFRPSGERRRNMRERSLSPYSKRLALTQAMNM